MSSDYMDEKLKKSGKESLGIVEKAKLFYIGRCDGKHSAIGIDNNGSWTSATIQRDIDAFNETYSLLYAKLQIELESRYSEASFLADRIEYLERQIIELNESITPIPGEEVLSKRKYGEEYLLMDQIIARRKREYEKSISGTKIKIGNLLDEKEQNYHDHLRRRTYRNKGSHNHCFP